MVRPRARIRFRKEGDLRLVGHRDLMHVWERLLRRARVSVRMTEGFHPRPRINFPSALSVGVCGRAEVVELDLDEEFTAEGLAAAIAPHAPAGLAVESVELLPVGSKPAQVRGMTFELPVPRERHQRLSTRIRQFLALPTFPIERDGRRKPLDLRPLIEDLELVEGRLRMQVRVTSEGSAKPGELLAALELEDLSLEDLAEQGLYLTRTGVELET